MNAIEQLKSVLCDPAGKCCITGSDEDRAIVDRALQALAAPVQSAERGEPVWCGHCNGSGRMVRDPDIGTDQECFVCDGAGVLAAPVQEPVALEAVYETIINWDEGGGKRSRRELARRIVDLYTTPPTAQRQWVGLTDEKINRLWRDSKSNIGFEDFDVVAKEVEAQIIGGLQ